MLSIRTQSKETQAKSYKTLETRFVVGDDDFFFGGKLVVASTSDTKCKTRNRIIDQIEAFFIASSLITTKFDFKTRRN